MKKITIEDLAGQESQINLDLEALEKSRKVSDRRLWTYLISYPYLVNYFEKANSIHPSELIIGNAIVYGLMPTTMNLKRGYFEDLLDPLNQLKENGSRLSVENFSKLKKLVNNSVTGTSKLLHFINPKIYPIWDSRINRFITGSKSSTNTISRYEEYLSNFDELNQDKRFGIITSSLSKKIDYEISNSRAFEMILYLSDLFGLKLKPKVLSSREAVHEIKIPKYKRDIYTFVSNLGEVTADPMNPSTVKRDGYLLSEHYTDEESIERALWVRSRRNLLISDNGNWTRMSAIGDEFENEGEVILDTAREEVENNRVVSSKTLEKRRQLMNRIIARCEEEISHVNFARIIETQLLIKPHYMIGLEDFTIPVLMMCGMMDEVFDPSAKAITKFQLKTAELFTQEYNGEFGYKEQLNKVAKFLVLHSYDYESAYLGAQHIKKVPKEGIAISYGAPMRSRRWIKRLQFGKYWEDLGEKLPESYLIAQSMTLGAVNGLTDDTPIHILGVGTPILIALTGYLLRRSKAVSIDSTAPFKDAYDNKLYGNRYAPLKMKMYRVAALALINDKPYESKTPFFQEFNKKYPPNWEKTAAEFGVTKTMDYRELADELEKNQNLVRKYIPFFTKLRSGDDPFWWDLRIARSGHNYWVLKEICEDIKYRKEDPNKLKEWTESQVENYQKYGSRKWALAVKKAYKLTEKYRIQD